MGSISQALMLMLLLLLFFLGVICLIAWKTDKTRWLIFGLCHFSCSGRSSASPIAMIMIFGGLAALYIVRPRRPRPRATGAAPSPLARKASTRDPNNSEYGLFLGRIYLDAGHFKAAL